MANKGSDSCRGLKKRRAERFTCTIDSVAEISYCRGDQYSGTEEAGCLSPFVSERQEAKIANLSLVGAKLLTKIPIGRDVSVTIRIGIPPNRPSFERKARVIWCKSARSESGTRAVGQNYVGVAFYDMGWRQRFQLKKAIKWLSMEL